MRVLVVLACVTLANCEESIESIDPAVTTTSGQGLKSQQSASRIFGILGSPVGGGSFGQAPLSVLPANFFSSFNRAPKPQPLGHFQPFLHQPVVQPQTAPPKIQVSETDVEQQADGKSLDSPPKRHVLQADATAPAPAIAESRSLFVAEKPSLTTAESTVPLQIVAAPQNQIVTRAQANQILGILQPQPPPSRSNDILSELMPEFIEITNKLESRGITGKGRTQAKEVVESFMPLMRKVMTNQAELEGRTLTQQEIDAINFAEKTVGPFVTFGYDVSEKGLGFNNPTLPKSDVPNDFFAQMMIDLLPDLTRIVKQVKREYGGWPGTGSAVEVMNIFMPFARRVVESQARIEGRFITREEQDYLRFGEDTVPILMKYAQDSFITGKSLEAAEKYNIVEVIQQAWEKLNKDPKF